MQWAKAGRPGDVCGRILSGNVQGALKHTGKLGFVPFARYQREISGIEATAQAICFAAQPQKFPLIVKS